MPRWVGLLGSWALLVLGVGLVGYAVAAEAITVSDARKLHRVQTNALRCFQRFLKGLFEVGQHHRYLHDDYPARRASACATFLMAVAMSSISRSA